MDGDIGPIVAEPLCFGRPRVAANETEVVVVGGGIGGALLALALARKGVRVAVVDLHEVYPADFRCEKLNPDQIAMLAELKLADAFAGLAPDLAERGFRYADLVAAARGAWPRSVKFVVGRVEAIENGPETQSVVLASGERLTGRLVVLATGPTDKLRASLGVGRRVVRERHSVCIGLSLAPAEGASFDFPGLVHHGERAGDGMAYASFFPLGETMRVNLFAHRGPRDAWTLGFREDPLGRLLEAMPGLKPLLAGARVVEPAEIRATDLYETEGHALDGVVIIGDAFRSCCPATGLGVTRILTEIAALTRAHLPTWLATPGMGADKIAGFYGDPAKRRIDTHAARRAETVRAISTRTDLGWRTYRGLAGLKRTAKRLVRRDAAYHA